MAIFNNLDVGQFSQNQGPSGGQEGGSILVEGAGTLSWARGAREATRSTVINVQAPFPIGAAAAGSRQAVRYAVQQLVEMSLNADLQPVYIQWESGHGNIVASPYDGWYRLDDVTPLDFTFNSFVPCQVTATRVAVAAPASLAMAYAGGALSSDFSGAATAKNLVPLLMNASATSEGSFARATGDGALYSVPSPVENPLPTFPPSAISDLFKSRVRVFDTLNTGIHGIPVPATGTLWHSLGTEAGTDNSIAYWTQSSGSWSFSAHVAAVTVANGLGAVLTGGHGDWGDCVATARIKCPPAGAFAYLQVHSDPGGGGINKIDLALQVGTNQTIEKVVNTVYSSLGNVVTSGALVAGTFYWVRILCAGTTYTFQVFADSAGAIGALLGQATLTIADASVQTGPIALAAYNTSGAPQTFNYGGAFANVCTVTGPVPTNGGLAWTTNVNAGEPAFCWSRTNGYVGTFSLSIYNAAAGGNGYWMAAPNFSAGTRTVRCALRTTQATGTVVAFFNGAGVTASSNAAGTSGWQASSLVVTLGSTSNLAFYAQNAIGTSYCDTVVSTNALNAVEFADEFELPYNGNWVEVFDRQHNFVGDCIVANGLLLLLIRPGDSDVFTAWLWNTALASAAWQIIGSVIYVNNAFLGGTTRSYTLVRVGAEECSIQVVGATTDGQVAIARVRLQRGRYEARIDIQPKSQGPNNGFQLLFNSNVGNAKVAYSPAGVRDTVIEPNTGAANATDYGYGSFYPADSARPWIAGFLYQRQPVGAQPRCTSAAGQLAIGDTVTFPVDSRRLYGLFVIPYGVSGAYSTAHLQVEGESAQQMDSGWSSVADAAGSGGNAAKILSGTVTGRTLGCAGPTGYVFIPPPGIYDLWVRARVTSAAGSGAEMKIGLFDNTAGSYVAFTIFAANQSGTSYGWLRVATGVTPTANHVMIFVAQSAATLGTDWFLDEFAFVPKTLTDDIRGPQDLWQQFMYDRDVVMVTD